MENIVTLAIPALLAVALVRTLFQPMKWALRLGLHAGGGFLCLWLLNTVSGFTGIAFPLNAVTVLISGTLGIPGMAAMALLELV